MGNKNIRNLMLISSMPIDHKTMQAITIFAQKTCFHTKKLQVPKNTVGWPKCFLVHHVTRVSANF
jgi:hypothetical protein